MIAGVEDIDTIMRSQQAQFVVRSMADPTGVRDLRSRGMEEEGRHCNDKALRCTKSPFSFLTRVKNSPVSLSHSSSPDPPISMSPSVSASPPIQHWGLDPLPYQPPNQTPGSVASGLISLK